MLWKGTWGPGAPRTGTYSYLFSNRADGYWRTLQLAARAGEQYDLYAYIRGELDADTTQGRFLIRAKFMDSNGASLGCSDITAMYPGAISSWTRVGGRVTAPANSVSMQVQYLLYQSSGWVNIDDVEITIVPPNAATEVTKYYYFGSQRVAMRKNGVLTYLHGDHLGSTGLETNITGTVTTDEKYLAYGKQRDSGKVTTDHRFTGQKEDASGLQYFHARFYDPVSGMFVSPDTMVPDAGNVFAYDRYMYVYGRVMNANDPSGHFTDDALKAYLKEIHGDLWDGYWKMWNENTEWMDFLHFASGGQVFADLRLTSGGNLYASLYQFVGKGQDELTGVNQVTASGDVFAEGVMLEVLRPQKNHTIANGVLNMGSDGTFYTTPTNFFSAREMSQYGGESVGNWDFSLSAGRPVNGVQAFGYKAAQALGVGYAGDKGSVLIFGEAAEKSGPWPFIVGTLIELAVDQTITNYQGPAPGTIAGDQAIRIYAASESDVGYVELWNIKR